MLTTTLNTTDKSTGVDVSQILGEAKGVNSSFQAFLSYWGYVPGLLPQSLCLWKRVY